MTKFNKKRSITELLLIFLLIILALLFVLFAVYIIYNFSKMKQNIWDLRQTVELALSGDTLSLDQQYYELSVRISEHADNRMDYLIAVVGIIATVYSIFGALIVFQAPREIDKKLSELDDHTIIAAEAANEAKCLSEILDAKFQDYNGENTNFAKIKNLTSLINKYPDNYAVYIERGIIYNQCCKYDLAIADFQTALRYCKNNQEDSCYNALGIAYRNKGNHARAIKYFDKAIELSSDVSAYYSNRGICFSDLGDFTNALTDFEISLSLDKENKGALVNRSNTYWKLMNKSNVHEERQEYQKKSIDDMLAAINMDPDDQKLKNLLNIRFRQLINTNELLADMGEKHGDQELSFLNLYEAANCFLDALYYSLLMWNKDENNDGNVDRIKRVCSKLFELNQKIDFQTLENYRKLESIIILLLNSAIQIYRSGDWESTEKIFTLLMSFNTTRPVGALDLAYMKRRNETKFCDESIKDLLSEFNNRSDGIWCVNVALCHVTGVEEFQKDWKTAIEIMNNAVDTQQAIEWWCDIELVGNEESNLVMILFALSTAFSFEDTKPIEERIKEARNSGYSIPPELLQNLE